MQEFCFYLYSRNQNKRFYFNSSDDAVISRMVGMINALPKVEGGNVTALLHNTIELRDCIADCEAELKKTLPQVQRILPFVRSLEEGEYLYYLDGKAPLINHLCCIAELRVLPDMTKRRQVHNSILAQYGELFTAFESHGFGYDRIKTVVGDNYNNPCRFCGRDRQHTSFRKEAHAIAQALGNDILFCNEECGDCNARLASVEDNLTNHLDVNRVIAGIRTKDGELPEIEGENFVIRRQGDSVAIYAKGTASEEDILKTGIRLEHRKTVTNLGIYKALVKTVMDLLPSEKMQHFSETIGWINGKVISKKMPSIYWRYCKPFQQPQLFLFLNEFGKQQTPYCTAVLYVCNVVFMFVVPFVDVDGGQFKHDSNLTNHWPLFFKTFPGDWMSWDLSDDTPAKPFIEFDIKGAPTSGGKVHTPIPEDVFAIHRRTEKRTYVEFPEIDYATVFREPPVCRRVGFVVENQDKCCPQPTTELSFNQGCDILINTEKGQCLVAAVVTICDSPNTTRYIKCAWNCTYLFTDITKHLELTDNDFSFDCQLRDFLWNLTLSYGEQEFQTDIDQTKLKAIKLSCAFDEHHLHFIRYFAEKGDNLIFLAYDKDIHRG